MKPSSHTDSNRSDFVLTVLEWLDSCDVCPESVDQTFSILSHRRRRLLLEVMRTYGEELTLPDAAEEVTKLEVGAELAAISAERVAEVYISLYHDHLPQLVDGGLLEYDQERDLVAPSGI